MDKKLYIIFILLFPSLIYCNIECSLDGAHAFKVKDDEKLSFSAEINKRPLIIDINYQDKENDRIWLSPNTSYKVVHNGNKYTRTELNSSIDKGWEDINLLVDTSTLNIISTNSQKSPLVISLSPGISSIKVSSDSIKICRESCNIESSIEKIVSNEGYYKITAFTTSQYPITFILGNSVEEDQLGYFEMKPEDCLLKWKQTRRIIPCKQINPGWNIVNIFMNKSTITINDHMHLPIDASLKSLKITGSYLVNCTQGNPVWNVSKEEIPIPVSFGKEISFILSSTVEFSPVFNISGIELPLNWNNGLKFGLSGNPLPPKKYYMIYRATSDILTIYDEQISNALVELQVEKPPDFIRVSSLKGEYKFVISVKDTLEQQTEPPTITETYLIGTSSKVELEENSKVGYTIYIILIVFQFVYIVYLKRKSLKCKNDDGKQDHLPKTEENGKNNIDKEERSTGYLKNSPHERSHEKNTLSSYLNISYKRIPEIELQEESVML